MKEKQKPTLTVPLSEVLEILRLAVKIENPTAAFRKDDQLMMANEVIKNSIGYAGRISELIYRWTHPEEG